MEQVKGFKIEGFPLKEAKKIDDIIFFDEPILSHYSFCEEHYLYYNVDDENQLNTFLVFNIIEYDLFKLITGKISLKEAIFKSTKNMYLVDFNNKNEIVNTLLILKNDIIDNYLPEDSSILELSFSEDSYYVDLINKHQESFYLETLRKTAFYLKFEPINRTYENTIGLLDLSNKLLSKISKSYDNYIKINFQNSFENYITDEKKLKQTFARLKEYLDPRMVDVAYGSFEIGIAFDKIQKQNIEDQSLKNWALNIGNNFKSDVIEFDFDNNDEVDRINLIYNENQRKEIFKPFFDLTEDNNYKFSYKRKKLDKFDRIKIVKKENINKIIIEKLDTAEIESNKEYELLHVTAIKEKGKLKKFINLNNTLFSTIDNTLSPLTHKDFEKHGFLNVDKNINIELKIEVVNKNSIQLSTNIGGEYISIISSDSTNLDIGIHEITKKIYEYLVQNE